MPQDEEWRILAEEAAQEKDSNKFKDYRGTQLCPRRARAAQNVGEAHPPQ
jgi:hypothetical protein